MKASRNDLGNIKVSLHKIHPKGQGLQTGLDLMLSLTISHLLNSLK